MMAGGNAVCGSSAIASIAPSIHAKEEEKGQIITLVNLLGTVMMLTLLFLDYSCLVEISLKKVHFWVVHSICWSSSRWGKLT